MPNKNSIESEIDELLNPLQPFIELTNDLDEWHELKQETKSKLKSIIQREVKKGRVEELDALHDDLSLEAREAGACEAIHKRTNSILDRLEELEG